MATVYA